MLPRLLGLYSNGSRAGKDSVARFFVDNCGFEQRNMANNIRQLLLKINPYLHDGHTLQHVYTKYNGDWDIIKAEYPESVDMMIGLGQGARDLISENVWLDSVFNEFMHNPIVIADIRQPNEYKAIRQRGGQVWKIVRDSAEIRGMDGLLEGFEFEHVINNNGTLEDLENELLWIINYENEGN